MMSSTRSLLDSDSWRPEQLNGDQQEEEEGEVGVRRCCDAWCFLCCCRVTRVAAAFIGIAVAMLNILTASVCIYLVNNTTVNGEKFNCIFIATINCIMLLSDYLLLHGSVTKNRSFVMSWIITFGALLFLQNIVGVLAFIVAVSNRAEAWYYVIFAAMLALDFIYTYSIVGIFNFCRTLRGYESLP